MSLIFAFMWFELALNFIPHFELHILAELMNHDFAHTFCTQVCAYTHFMNET